MADYMRWYTSTWKSDFTGLTHDEQWLYFTLSSQPDISNCGVLALTPGRWSTLAADTDADSVRLWLAALEAADKVVIDHRSEELWVRAYMKTDGLAKMNPNGLKSVRRAVDEVLSDQLRERIDNELARVLGTVDGTVEPLVGLPQQPAASSRDLHPRPAAAAPTTSEHDADSSPDIPPAAALALDYYVAWRRSEDRGVRHGDRWAAKVRKDELAANRARLIELATEGSDAAAICADVWAMDNSAVIIGRHALRSAS